MAESTLWWILAGFTIALELLSGTFYLLMLALGMAAAAIAAHLGASLVLQFAIAAAVSSLGVVAWRIRKKQNQREPSAQANPNVNLDIGETVQVQQWNADGTADVHYRGARWTVMHRTGISPSPGAHRVAEVIGNRLLVDKS